MYEKIDGKIGLKSSDFKRRTQAAVWPPRPAFAYMFKIIGLNVCCARHL